MLLKAGIILILLLSVSTAFPQPAAERSFEVQKVGEGVYAVIRREPAGFWFNANNVFIVGKKDVIVKYLARHFGPKNRFVPIKTRPV